MTARGAGATLARGAAAMLARRAAATLLVAGASACATAADDEAAACGAIDEPAARLACYDKLFRRAAPAAQPDASPSAASPPARTTATPRAGGRPGTAAPTTRDAPSLLVSNLFDTAWELSPERKRGTFVVRTYLPNFVLPLHYTNDINTAPTSPGQTGTVENPNYRNTQVKLQVSLRAKLVEGLVLPGADLWAAYTQRSMWQVYDHADSSPFRSTDYLPEVLYVVPVPARLGTLAGGWRWRMGQVGFVHQSNGQSDPLSRSWNRVYAAAGVDRGEFGLTARLYKRLNDKDDDNPDITRLVGNTELTASWLPGRSTFSLTWRMHPAELRRGSLQLDWTHPVDRDQPDGLRWYGQLFTGYGETLLDYNHRQTTIGLGLTLFQF